MKARAIALLLLGGAMSGTFVACDIVVPLGPVSSTSTGTPTCQGAPCGAPCDVCGTEPNGPPCSSPPLPLSCDGLGQCVEDVQCAEVPCGNEMCGPGKYCCNESCGLCAPLGAVCSNGNCDDPPPCDPEFDPGCCDSSNDPNCCNPGDPSCCNPGDPDCCDPAIDPNCFGDPCGPTICPFGSFCCDPACGQCAVDGQNGPECIPDPNCEPQGEPCGNNFCENGTVCCNPSCGICAGPNDPCPPEPCGMLNCNLADCGQGEVCCNFECSLCWPAEADIVACSEQQCGQPPNP